jgi:hypothetical protein
MQIATTRGLRRATLIVGTGVLLVYGVVYGLKWSVSGWSPGPDVDATKDHDTWGGYRPGMRLKLREKANIIEYNLFTKRNALQPASVATQPSPTSFSEYNANPSRWPDIHGMVEAGTVVEVSRFVITDRTEYAELGVFARVAGGGPYANKEVWLNWLSEKYYDQAHGTLYRPDAKYLEAVP